MDVFSHGLWAGAVGRGIGQVGGKKLSMWRAAAWGVFPDVVAFAPWFVWFFWNIALGTMTVADLPRPEAVEPAVRDTLPIFRITSLLYSVSHSLVLFFLVSVVVVLIMRRVPWVMGGWLLHILMDIPTHSYQFYPTPFLWPLSEWKFDGFSWGTPWFIIVNYSTLAIIYFLLWKKRKQYE
ncbi:MAG: hypothetical protein NUV61_04110 [Candidatus Azambacteria bacterium]|nr:hypothetical protein [Candidatus Azambacteria bacterium]